MRRARVAAALVASVALGLPAVAMAGGITVPRIGGLNFSSPVEATPTALWWNPAAMGITEGLQLQLDFSYTLASGSYERTIDRFGDPATYEPMDFKVGAPSPLFAATLNIGRFSFGLGTYIPYGRSVSYPGAEDARLGEASLVDDTVHPGRYHLIETSFRHWYVPLGASVEVIRDLLWVGATLNVIYGQFRTVAAVDRSFGLEDPGNQAISRIGAVCHGENADGTCVDDGGPVSDNKFLTSLALGANFGLLLRSPSKNITLGASFSTPVRHHFRGKGVFTVPTVVAAGLDSSTVEADVDVTYWLPWTFNVGAQYKLSFGLEVDLWYTYQHYKVHDVFDICVGSATMSDTPGGVDDCAAAAADNEELDPNSFVFSMLNKATIRYRGYKAHHVVALGLAYPFWEDRIKVGVNFWYENSAVPESAVTVSSIDGKALDTMLTISVTPVEWLTINAGFSYIWGPKTDNTGTGDFRRLDPAEPIRGTEEFGPGDGIYSLNVIRFGGGLIVRPWMPKKEKKTFDLPDLPEPEETAPAETAPAETAPAETAPAETAPVGDPEPVDAPPAG